jgi:hypothetical protein
VPESGSSDKQVVQMELETLVQENISIETSTLDVKEQHTIATDRPRHNIRPPTMYGFEDIAFYAFVISNGDPTTF